MARIVNVSEIYAAGPLPVAVSDPVVTEVLGYTAVPYYGARRACFPRRCFPCAPCVTPVVREACACENTPFACANFGCGPCPRRALPVCVAPSAAVGAAPVAECVTCPDEGVIISQ